MAGSPGVSRVLVLSLGNPEPYLDTLHSAGHHALEALRRELQLPPFARSKRFGKQPAQMAADRRYTLVQSPTLMNVSGPWVARVWKDLLAEERAQNGDPAPEATRHLGLVLIHDDLEEALGVLKTRPWAGSHRGHNGLKSVNVSLRRQDYPGAHWAKLSVGIGRPGERDRSSVSDYVLRPMDARQRAALGPELGAGLLRTLRAIEAQWEAEAARNDSRASAANPPIPPPSKSRTRPNTKPA